MCMALANGNQPEPPTSRWQRLWQWLGFSALLARMLAVGLWQWVGYRWAERGAGRSVKIGRG